MMTPNIMHNIANKTKHLLIVGGITKCHFGNFLSPITLFFLLFPLSSVE